MPVILGLYIFIPFVANALNKCDAKIIVFPITLAVLYSFGVSTTNIISQIIWKKDIFLRTLDISFSGRNYGILLIIGWMIKKEYFKRVPKIYWFILTIIGYMATLLLQLCVYSHDFGYNVWYDSMPLLATSFGIFNLLLNVKTIPHAKMITWFSKMSFAVYLLHEITVILLARYIKITGYEKKAIIIWLSSIFISYVVVFLISLNKKLAKILFYLR